MRTTQEDGQTIIGSFAPEGEQLNLTPTTPPFPNVPLLAGGVEPAKQTPSPLRSTREVAVSLLETNLSRIGALRQAGPSGLAELAIRESVHPLASLATAVLDVASGARQKRRTRALRTLTVASYKKAYRDADIENRIRPEVQELCDQMNAALAGNQFVIETLQRGGVLRATSKGIGLDLKSPGHHEIASGLLTKMGLDVDGRQIPQALQFILTQTDTLASLLDPVHINDAIDGLTRRGRSAVEHAKRRSFETGATSGEIFASVRQGKTLAKEVLNLRSQSPAPSREK